MFSNTKHLLGWRRIAALLVLTSLVAIGSGRATAEDDMECANGGGTCFNATVDAQPGGASLCGHYGSGSGGYTYGPCEPTMSPTPCQGSPSEQHACIMLGCFPNHLKVCEPEPNETCITLPQPCGTTRPGKCSSTRSVVSCTCNPPVDPPVDCYMSKCTWGECVETGGDDVNCTPPGCGLVP